MKLTEIKGASLLPKEKQIPTIGYMGEMPEIVALPTGYNSAVTKLEQCSVEVEIEEMAKDLHMIRHTIFTNMFPWELLKEHDKEAYRKEAQQLSKCKQNWLVLERCE